METTHFVCLMCAVQFDCTTVGQAKHMSTVLVCVCVAVYQRCVRSPGVISQMASCQFFGGLFTGLPSFLHGETLPNIHSDYSFYLFCTLLHGQFFFSGVGVDSSVCVCVSQAAAALHAVLCTIRSFLQSWKD